MDQNRTALRSRIFIGLQPGIMRTFDLGGFSVSGIFRSPLLEWLTPLSNAANLAFPRDLSDNPI
jgi:hypothetical protein